MEIYSTFHELNQFLNEENGSSKCERILSSLNRSLIEDQFERYDIDIFIIHLFHPSHGLIQFTEKTLGKASYKNSRVKALEILCAVVNNFHNLLRNKDVLFIYSLSARMIASDTEAIVKDRLFQLLMLCFERIDTTIEGNESVTTYQKLLKSLRVALNQKYCDSVKGKELYALGYFLKKFSYLVSETERKDIKKIFWFTFQHATLNPRTLSQTVLCGFFKGFMHYCEIDQLKKENDEDNKIIQKIYTQVKSLSVLSQEKEKTKTIKVANRAGILFMANNMNLFEDDFLVDYEYWHKNLLKWLREGNEEMKTAVIFLNSFLRTLGVILETTEYKKEYLYVSNYFEIWSNATLKNKFAGNNEKRLALTCLRQFSASFKKYFSKQKLTELFLSVERIFEQTYVMQYDPKDEEWEYLPYYIQALASFSCFREFTLGEFLCLQKGVVNMIQSYPHFQHAIQYGVIDGLIMTFHYLRKTEYFDGFMQNVVHQGVIWACSHQHISVVELSSEILSKKNLTIQDYLALWTGLINFSPNKSSCKYGFSLEDRRYLLERLTNELIKTLISIVNKLNLSVKPIEEDIAMTDPERAFQVERRSDYSIFLNVVDFYREIFNQCDFKLFSNHISKMVTIMIHKCIKNPLVSGFYKLLSFVLKMARKSLWFENKTKRSQDVSNCLENLRIFLPSVLNSMSEYKDELLASCLQVVLEAPITSIREVIQYCETPFINIFSIGKSYLPLAEMGIDTLERWQENIEPEIFDSLLVKVLPHLDSFLRSRSLRGHTNSTLQKRRKTTQTLNKRKIVVEIEPELVTIQRKILTFIGKQNLNICQAFIFSNDMDLTDTILGHHQHLKITLPYEDLHFEIYLDTFLPKIVDLARHSSDRKIRATACELLHATVMVLLGKAKAMSMTGISELNEALKVIAITILELGCDADLLIKQMFEPLFLQLTHWYSSSLQNRNPHTAIIIDTLMDGITHPTNSSLRDFSGECVQEFVKWTIKQNDEDTLRKDPINIKTIVKKMRYFSTHPDSAKKLGCAVIFNNIYCELREEDALISIFWIEILHIFVNSLNSFDTIDECNNNNTIEQIKKAVMHLKRVFIQKASIFRKPDSKRRIPNDLNDGLLKDVSVWLLLQSGSKSKHCREICMELFTNITPLVSGENLRTFIQQNVPGSILAIYDEQLFSYPRDHSGKVEYSVLFMWMKSFLCTLDGYNFVLKSNLEEIDLNNSLLCSQIYLFLNELQDKSFIEALNLISMRTWNYQNADEKLFSYLKSGSILGILELYNSVLNDAVQFEKADKMFHPGFWKLLLNIIFRPRLVNINHISRPTFEDKLKTILNRLTNKLPKVLKNDFINHISLNLNEHEIVTEDILIGVDYAQRNFVHGLLLLNSSETSEEYTNIVRHFTNGLTDKLMTKFYENLIDNKIIHKSLGQTTIEYINDILKFSLVSKEELNTFLQHFFQPYVVQSIQFQEQKTFGVYILTMFSDTIMPFIIGEFELFLNVAMNSEEISTTIEILIFILNYLTKNKILIEKHNISLTLMRHWNKFEEHFNSNIKKGIKFVKLLQQTTTAKPIEIHSWLINCLLEDGGDNSFDIFELLVLTVIEDNTNLSSGLENCLSCFAENNFGNNQQLSENQSGLINKILSLFPYVKSAAIAKFLIHLYLRIPTNENLEDFFITFAKNADKNLQLNVLKISYEILYDKNRDFEKRYKLAKNLVPCLLRYCRKKIFQTFYAETVPNMLEYFSKENEFEINIFNFIYVELLFELSEPEEIGSLYKDSNLSNQCFLSPALDAFKIHNCNEICRKYRCHAYNATVSMISNFSKFNKLFIKLFIRKDKDTSEDILWKGLIDTNKEFNFPLFFDRLPKQRKILLSIRNELKKNRIKNQSHRESLEYIASQRLFSSSLSEDVTNFDFTNSIVRLENADENELNNKENCNCQREIFMENTEVNNHECMATICGFIQHIFDSGLSVIPDEDENNVELPCWMNGIRTTLMDTKTHKNIKIFLVKVIDNLINIFTHYSKWFLEPLLQFVVEKCAGDTINYFITDVLIILSKWAPLNEDLSEKERILASELLRFLTERLSVERTEVFKYNLDNIKLIVEAWKSVLKVPTQMITNYIASKEKCVIGIHLTSIFLVNKLEVWNNNEKEHFLDLLLSKLSYKSKAVIKPCAETIGLLIKYLDDEIYTSKVDGYLKKVDYGDYLVCLQGVAIHYPRIVNSFHIVRTICALKQCNVNDRILRLKIIGKRLGVSCDILHEISDFRIVDWHEFLEDSNLDIQINTLDIIKKSIDVVINLSIFPEIVKSLFKNIHHTSDLFRSCLYDIAFLIWEKNTAHSETARNILIIGLTDSSEDNKNKVVDIWRDKMNLPDHITIRFAKILSELYVPKIEDHFLGFANYFFIALLTTYDNFNDLLFEHPLEDCNFEDYKLQTNWRIQHPSVVPLFAETLQTFDSDITQEHKNYFQLRQTQNSLDFTPTLSSLDAGIKTAVSLDSSLSVSSSDTTFKDPNSFELSQKYRQRKRFLADKKMVSREFAHYETKKGIFQNKKRVETAKERDKNVVIYRNYRKGDFPDIQIALSAVLKPLQMLALQNSEVSKMLFQEILNGISSRIGNNDEFLETISKSINHIFHSSTSFNPHLIGAMLNILLKNSNKIRIDPQLITYVCKESGLVSVGTLLLEEYINTLDDQPSGSKKGIGCEESTEILHWVQLASLYKQLEEWDVVQAIFLEKMNCNELIKEAIKYESESSWKNAQKCYTELLDADFSQERKDFYYESCFRCFANLGEWEKLPEYITSVLEEGKSPWDTLWDGGWNQQKLLPWYITSQVKNGLFSEKWSEVFLKNINNCLSDESRGEYLKSFFSEELCMMALGQNDIPLATGYLQSYIKYFLQDWQLIKPMLQSLRYQKLLRLKGFIETSEFINVYNNLQEEFECSVPKIINKWETLSKEVLPSVMLNETRHLYRSQFISILKEKLSTFKGIDTKTFLKNLKICKLRMDLNFINTTAECNNFYLAKKYYEPHKGKKHVKIKMSLANMFIAKSKMDIQPSEELNKILEAQNILGELLRDADHSLLHKVSGKLYDNWFRISEILSDPNLFTEYETKISNMVQNPIKSCDDITFFAYNQLKKYILSQNEDMDSDNKDYVSKLQGISDAYVKLAYFIRNKNDDNLQGEFITFVLRSMKMDSMEGVQLFPCVLMQNKLGNECRQIFIEESDKIPTWMFLGWVPQLLGYLNSDRIFALSKIVLKMAETYPQAIMFPYRLSRGTYSSSNNGIIAEEIELLTQKLDTLLLNNALFDKFLKALSYVCVPTAVLRYYVGKMYKCQNQEDFKKIQGNVMSDVFTSQYDSKKEDYMQGNIYKKSDKFKRDFSKLGSDMAKLNNELSKLDIILRNVLDSEEKNSSLLQDYCPWLANFSGYKHNDEIEIPGQYDGKKLPLPQHHAKISGFLNNVLVMKSIRKPIKITIVGSDTKEYPFLVKFGEDIRQDQRIEQLFSLTNEIYKSDTLCTNNGLRILTYQVIPLTTNLGLIQWIDPTQTLNGFLEKSKKDYKKINDKTRETFEKWLPTGKSMAESYGNCAERYKRDKVIAYYTSLVYKIPMDILRKSFELLSTDTENFIALRNNFIKTYAVMCISQWVLGIGDRHLDNSLICLNNGQVLGIDFGHAFGTATQILPIPELVPIRLTPHLLSFMEPLGGRGNFKAYMTHCLKAMRNNSNSLLATMNVFIEEPSLDWLEHAARFENVEESNLQNWFPLTKVKQAQRKLKGASSTKILIEDLLAGNNKSAAAYVKLVTGDPQYNKRVEIEDENLTAEEQVECLLDHATDYNLLGRMFGGWRSWV